ncbi:MAG: hypothetical protein N2654_06405 [Deltaproteobacteria bacterium]|nr:hypothetical protein [Deltaproteobacteria bacterium]
MKLCLFVLFVAGICLVKINLYNLPLLRPLTPSYHLLELAVVLLPIAYLQRKLWIFPAILLALKFAEYRIPSCDQYTEVALKGLSGKLPVFNLFHERWSWLEYVELRRFAFTVRQRNEGFSLLPIELRGTILQRVFEDASQNSIFCYGRQWIVFFRKPPTN